VVVYADLHSIDSPAGLLKLLTLRRRRRITLQCVVLVEMLKASSHHVLIYLLCLCAVTVRSRLSGCIVVLDIRFRFLLTVAELEMKTTTSSAIAEITLHWPRFIYQIVSDSLCYDYLPPTTEEVYAIARDVCLPACLSVCLLARLLKNACMGFDEILRVDRCRRTTWSTFEPDPDHSPDAGTGKSES